MKKLLFLFPFLFLFSCIKESLPTVETITRGNKWGLEIGDSAEKVYSRLQQLGVEKDFYQIAIVGRNSYSGPADLGSTLIYYDAITLQKNSGRIERVLVQFPEDTVALISAGGALPEEVNRWPLNVPDSSALIVGDEVMELYSKLQNLYQTSNYDDFSIILPDKPLSKSFDPEMKKFTEWSFSFFVDAGPGKRGRSDVRLYFEAGSLEKIYHKYDEFQVQL